MTYLERALAESKAREEKATSGPWCSDDGAIITLKGETGFNPWPGQCEYEKSDDDAEFIAASRTWEPTFRQMVESTLTDFDRIIQLCEQVMPNSGWMHLSLINSIHKTVKTAQSELERMAKEALGE